MIQCAVWTNGHTMPAGDAEIIDNRRAVLSHAEGPPADLHAKSALCTFLMVNLYEAAYSHLSSTCQRDVQCLYFPDVKAKMKIQRKRTSFILCGQFRRQLYARHRQCRKRFANSSLCATGYKNALSVQLLLIKDDRGRISHKMRPLSWRRPVHFLVISVIARYSIFNRLSSVENSLAVCKIIW